MSAKIRRGAMTLTTLVLLLSLIAPSLAQGLRKGLTAEVLTSEPKTFLPLAMQGWASRLEPRVWLPLVAKENKYMGCCVQASGLQENWEYDVWSINTNQPVFSSVLLELTQTPGRMLAGEASEVWRTDTGAAVWTASVVPPVLNVWSLSEDLGNGDIYAAGLTPGGMPGPSLYRSTDGGLNWALRSAVMGTDILHGSVYHNGYIFTVYTGLNTVYRSIDGGTTPIIVYDSTIFPLGPNAICSFNGALYLAVGDGAGLSGNVLRSLDDGNSWQSVLELGTAEPFYLFAPGDGMVYLATYGLGAINSLIYSSSSGIHWNYLSTPGNSTVSDLVTSDSEYYIILDDARIMRSGDLYAWNTLVDIGANARSILEYSGNSRLYASQTGDIWWSSLFTTVGRNATCLDETFIANKRNIAQLTDIYVYDASGPTWWARFPAPSLPFLVLPSPVATNDAIYFGIDPSVIDSGPFCSLVLDLIGGGGDYSIAWHYSDGAAGWPTLNVHDVTDGFRTHGVSSVHWVPPDDWAPEAVGAPAVTALWVRAVITVTSGTPLVALQQNRDVYTVNWPSALVNHSEVGGDIPALLRFKLHNRSDEDAYETKDELCLLDNRILASLRSVDRGEDFVPYINLAEDGIVANTYSQNPLGVVVTDGTGTTTTAEIRAASGIAGVHITQGNGLDFYDDAAFATFGPSITRDYYGAFHAFVRAHLWEYTTPSGDHDDVRVRLQIQTGAGGIIYTTEYRQFIGRDPWNWAGGSPPSGNPEWYKDFQLLDFGRITIPVTGSLRSDELPDQALIKVQIASSNGTDLRVTLYDLILLPVDEWAGDFVDKALEDDSGVSDGYALDVDSINYPKRHIRSLVTTVNDVELRKAEYQPITPSEAILQANSDQKLHFLTARGVYLGYHTGANNSPTLSDRFADFLDAGVIEGATVWNITDGSSAIITGVGEQSVGGALTGGAGNDWDFGDEYLLICPCWRSEPYVVHSIQIWKNQRYLSMRGNR